MQQPPPHSQGNERRGRRDNLREQQLGRDGRDGSGGLGAALFIGAALVVAGASALFGWYAGREKEVEQENYYTLPPRSGRGSGSPRATGNNLENCVCPKDEDCAGPKCVVCLERPQRFMFVQCRHICLCEPCLIHMGRNYEDTQLRKRFDGPVRLECPVCRRIGYVVKTYAA